MCCPPAGWLPAGLSLPSKTIGCLLTLVSCSQGETSHVDTISFAYMALAPSRGCFHACLKVLLGCLQGCDSRPAFGQAGATNWLPR